MKKTLLVAALATLTAGTAFAQSSVTIYGRLNVTGEYEDRDGVKKYVLANNASRIGFKGTEDLGGGLKANFILEHGFNVDNGTAAARFWGRQSEVNLESRSLGMVRLGNFTSEAYYATADYISLHNHDTGSSADALYAYLGRDGNKIAYRAPELVKGLTLEGAVSAGEGGVNQTRAYDFAANYNLGAIQLGFGAQRNNQQEQYAGRVLYEMGPFLFGAYYQMDTNGFAADGLDTYGDRNTFRLSGAYTMGAMEFHVNYGSADDYDKIADSSASQWTLGLNYNLSKRTKVYTYYTEVDDSSAKVYGGDFSSFAVGLRHNF